MPRIPFDRAKITEFCIRHHVRKLALFGSILRDDFGPDSDVDVVFDFEPGHLASLKQLSLMEEELSTLFGNRPVDLIPAPDLDRWVKAAVLSKAEVQYARN